MIKIQTTVHPMQQPSNPVSTATFSGLTNIRINPICCIAILLPLFLLFFSVKVIAASDNTKTNEENIGEEKKDPYKFKNKHIRFGVYLRTPEQMAAFYEGRGFPKNAINATSKTCFVTVGMRNTSKQKIWLDLKDWRFYSKQGPIQRIHRREWKKTWTKLKVPLASQSTFNWTLLPEARDLHPDEPVGGNLTFNPVDYTFTIEANFRTGENKEGKMLQVKIDNVRCETDSSKTN